MATAVPAQDGRDYMSLAAGNPPLVIDGKGTGWIAQADGEVHGWFVYQGCRLTHWPMPELGGVALHMLGGIEDQHGWITDAVLVSLTRPGLQALIRDLQAIDASLGDPA